MPNAYEVMDLRPGCGVKGVKARYRELAKVRHPDLGGSDKEFRTLHKAQEILIRIEERRALRPPEPEKPDRVVQENWSSVAHHVKVEVDQNGRARVSGHGQEWVKTDWSEDLLKRMFNNYESDLRESRRIS